MKLNNDWAFPDVNSIIDSDHPLETLDEALSLNENDRRLIELEECLLAKNEEIIRLTNKISDIENKKCEEGERLIQLSHKIHEIIPTIKSELMNLVTEMVNKISHKIIQQTVSNDDKLLMSVINRSIAALESAELIHVDVNPLDYEKMSHVILEMDAKWRVNPDLVEGDIIVTSEIAGIRIVLSEIINRMAKCHE